MGDFTKDIMDPESINSVEKQNVPGVDEKASDPVQPAADGDRFSPALLDTLWPHFDLLLQDRSSFDVEAVDRLLEESELLHPAEAESIAVTIAQEIYNRFHQSSSPSEDDVWDAVLSIGKSCFCMLTHSRKQRRDWYHLYQQLRIAHRNRKQIIAEMNDGGEDVTTEDEQQDGEAESEIPEEDGGS